MSNGLARRLGAPPNPTGKNTNSPQALGKQRKDRVGTEKCGRLCYGYGCCHPSSFEARFSSFRFDVRTPNVVASTVARYAWIHIALDGTILSSSVRRLELIATITRVTRILVLALLFACVADFSLDNARFDLVVITAALAILLSGGLQSP
jgi:hypothetical protein